MNRISIANSTFFRADAQPSQPIAPPAVQRLKNIHVPALIIAGGLDHSELLRAADDMANEIPAALKWVVPDTAHIPSMEKPAEFNQVVIQFLHDAHKGKSRSG